MGRHKGFHVSSETKQKISSARTGMSFSEEWKKNISEGKKRNPCSHPMSIEARQKISEARKGRKHSPETLQKMSASLKGNGLGKTQSSEAREKLSKYRQGKKHSEETRRKMSEAAKGVHSRELNGNWKGGIKEYRYCSKFNDDLKEQIRDTFGRKCFLCGSEENGRKLDVHHCDYNKGQGCGQRWSLIPLCRKCHAKTNGNRHFYFNLLSNYWVAKHVGIQINAIWI